MLAESVPGAAGPAWGTLWSAPRGWGLHMHFQAAPGSADAPCLCVETCPGAAPLRRGVMPDLGHKRPSVSWEGAAPNPRDPPIPHHPPKQQPHPLLRPAAWGPSSTPLSLWDWETLRQRLTFVK